MILKLRVYLKLLCKNFLIFLMGAILSSCVSHINANLELHLPYTDIALQMKAQPAELQRYSYQHFERKKLFFDGSVFSDEQKAADFKIQFKDESMPISKDIVGRVKTLEKTGELQMADLGFPDVNSEILMRWDTKGKVLYAGDHAKDSIYFVPSIPFPKGNVNLGDSWDFTAEWINPEGIVLKIDSVAILKQIKKCPAIAGNCALLEVSGNTLLNPSYQQMLAFRSELQGFFLIELETGNLVSTKIVSRDSFQSKEGPRENLSCLIGNLTFVRGKEIKVSEFQCEMSE